MKPEDERMKRIKTCRFIEEASRSLRLPRVAISTAMVFFHRFFAVHSFADHDRFEVAIACILIAAKTEESPRKLAHVIQECWKLKNSSKQSMASSEGNNKDANLFYSDVLSPSSSDNVSPRMTQSSTDKNGALDTKSEEFLVLKERVLLLERVVLHTIGFELSVDHPYKFLVEVCKRIVPSRLIEYTNPSGPSAQSQKSMMNDLVQCAMNFANDSMLTRLCLQYPPKQIALTCVYMSCQVCKTKPVENKSWIDILGTELDMEILSCKLCSLG
jgi:cyclin T